MSLTHLGKSSFISHLLIVIIYAFFNKYDFDKHCMSSTMLGTADIGGKRLHQDHGPPKLSVPGTADQ